MSERLLRAILRLAPRDFRQRYGAELLRVHRERLTGGETIRARFVFAAREALGLGWMVLRLRIKGDNEPHAEGGGVVTGTLQDLRYAGRTLRRNPGFTWAAVTVLALGIGATTAIFSAANAYFFRPLPFDDEDRLVSLYETNPEFGWTDADAAPANALDWRDQVEAFQDLALYSSFVSDALFVRDGEPILLGGASVSGNFFAVLGARPALGRVFRWAETWDGADDVAVLSHAAWRDHFGADPGVVGRTVELGGTSRRVVGVMAESFRFPGTEVDYWAPFGWEPGFRDATWFRRAHFVRALARVAPGVSVPAAEAQLQVVVARLSEEYPATNRVMGAGLMPVRDFMIRDVERPLLLLLGAVAVLLILAAVNVANLVLVRSADRAREVAVRHAMGAGRRRMVRQMLAESLLLALAGGVGGLGLGAVFVGFMERLTSLGIDGSTGVTLDHRVVLVAVGAALFSALVFGLAPAVGAARPRLAAALKDGGRTGSLGRRGRTGVRTLVVAEVALALLLVAGAGFMVRSFLELRAVDPGFNPRETLAVHFTLPAQRYPERADVLAFQDRFLEKLEARAGIERAGAVESLPLTQPSWSSQFQAEGWPPDRVGFEIIHRRADRGYFEALETPLVAGRLFGPDDGPESPPVVVVNETLAETHFPGEDPIGQRIAYDRAANENPDEQKWYEIVGIVGDQHQVSPGEPVRAEVFESRHQDWGRDAWIVARASGDPSAALAVARGVLDEMDPLVPVAEARTFPQVWRASMEREEFILSLLTLFGVVALLLATVGVYGVTAQAARTRTREIGIRMALGAGGAQVLGMVLRDSAVLVVMGLGAGLAGVWLGGAVLRSHLFGVTPHDPVTLTVVVLLLGGAGLAACYLPARRATTVDPVRSLRAE